LFVSYPCYDFSFSFACLGSCFVCSADVGCQPTAPQR
jgi:hypothetical protein